MMTRENALRKIVGLLKLASPRSGATLAEAQTAKALALHLMKIHEITPEDLRAPSQTRILLKSTYAGNGPSVHFSFTNFNDSTDTSSSLWF